VPQPTMLPRALRDILSTYKINRIYILKFQDRIEVLSQDL
jgi:hypothetical protein